MFASVGVSEEQVFGDLYLAWLKDTGEKNSNDSRKLFRELMEHGFRERQIVLRKERLGANVIASLASLLHRSPLARLDLHSNTLRDSGCEMVAHLLRDIPNLLYLDLGANDIGPQGIQALSYVVATHKKLQTLILGSSVHDAYANRIDAASATSLLEGCLRSRTLRHLDLSGSTIGDPESCSRPRGVTGAAEFTVTPPSRNSTWPSSTARRSQVASPTQTTGNSKRVGGGTSSAAGASGTGSRAVESPDIGSGGSFRRPIDVLSELIRTSTTLTTLKLREVRLTTDAALRIIHAAMESTSLSFVDLSGNELTGPVGDAFGELVWRRVKEQQPSRLHTILLSNNPLMQPNCSMPPPRLFSALSSDRLLVCLHLDSCGVDDAALVPLCRALCTNGALQSLHLDRNAITSEGAVMLARALCRHIFLQDVSLEGNVIRDEGTCAFASMLETNQTLISLNLSNTWMGERALVALGVALVENRTLQRLNIDNNHFSEDAAGAFAALLESNRYLLRCRMHGNSIGHQAVLRIDRITSRNREAHRNVEKDGLEKNVIRLHYQMYKLDEARAELENLQRKKLELGRALEALEAQFKQERADIEKKEQSLQDTLENCILQEARCLNEKKRLDQELAAAQKQIEVDMEHAKERLEAEAEMREKVDEEHRKLKLQLEDMMNNGPQREAAKRQQLQEVNEDRQRWAMQRKEYRGAIAEAQAAVNQLLERDKAAKKGKKGNKNQ
ncbi:hypothetical protein TraAM80_07888 [Trypanosoma rangeli]|uniref:Leucine-rich repeat protein (LRRP) n=1 Tax=Trypanosoma rangeli TaxID=5698 RepID=A0A3R7RCX5_TRYRA|nr:uncharacterized protein TraAM80_07888 [Trypanosoma rangeli]RNE99989.1 hypothetical protein TraAM80_07888 [Trypanosoma rangeli]|eukprot:RNE99989.1 hypothetical protein TraAM80_07888 [Trypanosoma rangeli]